MASIVKSISLYVLQLLLLDSEYAFCFLIWFDHESPQLVRKHTTGGIIDPDIAMF